MVDTTETIFIECIWQILDITISDGLFDLLFSIYMKHPLRFAVAHRQHGTQLRFGWTRAHPESINDWDQELYQMIRKDLMESLKLSAEWYDPSQSVLTTELTAPTLDVIAGGDLDDDDDEYSDDEDEEAEFV